MAQKQEMQKQTNRNLEIASRPNLAAAIQTGKKYEIATALRQYKTPEGLVNFPAVLSIPVKERLPEMAKNDFPGTAMIVTAALTLAFEGMNLKRGMTANQTIDLAETIIDESNQDYLSMEDVMLFLQKLVRGEYGIFYESMDIPKFMEKFELYRQERHEKLIQIRNEKHQQYKSDGDIIRNSKRDDLDNHFFNMADKIAYLSSELKHTKQELRDK